MAVGSLAAGRTVGGCAVDGRVNSRNRYRPVRGRNSGGGSYAIQNSDIGSNEGLRADLAPGGDNNPVIGEVDNWFDRSQFIPSLTGFFGNAGRNTVSSPGLAQFDLSFFKDFDFSERSKIQFRAEFFNLTNQVNFNDPGMSLFTGNSTQDNPIVNGEAGKITDTRTNARQVQFALKFIF